MKLSTIILALRAGNTYFGNRIGGAIDLARVQSNTLIDEVAFVIPLGEDASENDGDTAINQVIKERFGVICVIKNDNNASEKSGILAYDVLDTVRAGLVKILVNFDIGYESSIEYSAGRLLDIDRAWLWWQYEFVFTSRLASVLDGSGEIEYRDIDERKSPEQLPDLKRIYTDIILSPSASLPYNGTLPASSYVSVDQQWIDSQDKDDQNPGDYASSFADAFKVLMSNIIRR
jgi:hypothetical protein